MSACQRRRGQPSWSVALPRTLLCPARPRRTFSTTRASVCRLVPPCDSATLTHGPRRVEPATARSVNVRILSTVPFLRVSLHHRRTCARGCTTSTTSGALRTSTSSARTCYWAARVRGNWLRSWPTLTQRSGWGRARPTFEERQTHTHPSIWCVLLAEVAVPEYTLRGVPFGHSRVAWASKASLHRP